MWWNTLWGVEGLVCREVVLNRFFPMCVEGSDCDQRRTEIQSNYGQSSAWRHRGSPVW